MFIYRSSSSILGIFVVGKTVLAKKQRPQAPAPAPFTKGRHSSGLDSHLCPLHFPINQGTDVDAQTVPPSSAVL